MHEIKYFVTDIDGSLTDGKIYIGNDGEIMKAFSVKDGYAFARTLPQKSIETIVITGRKSKILENRCKELGIDVVLQGSNDKKAALIDRIGAEELQHCAFFGDDIIDLDCMLAIQQEGGIIGCPSDAARPVREIADYLCSARGGDGAAREFVEWLLGEKVEKETIATRVEIAIQSIIDLINPPIENGHFTITEWLTIEIKDVVPQAEEKTIVESHRGNIDIHYVLSGQEIVDFASERILDPAEEYDEQTDTAIWKPSSTMNRAVLNPGSYIILYPGEAHRACISQANDPEIIKLVVAKIRIN